MEQYLYHYKAKLVRVIDGDTIIVTIDRGFSDFSQKTLRINRIDTPEIRGPERQNGLLAKSEVETLISNRELIIKSHKLDSFGRCLSEVWYLYNDSWINLSDKLLELNLAEPYYKL